MVAVAVQGRWRHLPTKPEILSRCLSDDAALRDGNEAPGRRQFLYHLRALHRADFLPGLIL